MITLLWVCGRMNSQSMIPANKKQNILDAMLNLIVANGFHGTPMSLVAKEAEVAARTIYHYFDSKEAIINELYAILKQRMGQTLLTSNPVNLHFKTRFFMFWRNLYRYIV